MNDWLAPFLTLSNSALLGIAGAYLIGGFAKGALGFGLPLVTISILPYFIPIDLALALNAVALVLMNIGQFLYCGAVVDTIRRCTPLFVGLLLGSPIGAALVSIIDRNLLGLLLGIFVMVFVAVSMANPRLRIPPRWTVPIGWAAGLLAGIVGALTTANGPVLVMYLVAVNVPRTVFVASLAWLFLVTGVLNTLAYWSIGILDAGRLPLGLACVIPAAIGMITGNYLAARLPASLFRRVVLAVFFLLGANLVRRAILQG